MSVMMRNPYRQNRRNPARHGSLKESDGSKDAMLPFFVTYHALPTGILMRIFSTGIVATGRESDWSTKRPWQERICLSHHLWFNWFPCGMGNSLLFIYLAKLLIPKVAKICSIYKYFFLSPLYLTHCEIRILFLCRFILTRELPIDWSMTEGPKEKQNQHSAHCALLTPCPDAPGKRNAFLIILNGSTLSTRSQKE